MNFKPLQFFLVAVAVLTGCEHDNYEVEIRPDGDGFERQITCWRVGGEKGSPADPAHLVPCPSDPLDG